MRWRGQSPVLWRRPGESQLGSDPRTRLLVDGLSHDEQLMLSELGADLSPGAVTRAARRCSVPTARAHEIVGGLRHRGGTGATPADRLRDGDLFWERAGLDPLERRCRLADGIVALLGSGSMLDDVARLLLEEGVGAVVPEDDRLAAVVESIRPGATRAPAGQSADLVVSIEPHVLDPVRARGVDQAEVAHLPITVHATGVRIGPLLGAGPGPCPTCLGLWETEADPCWPALATQLRTMPAPAPARLVGLQAAATAARTACAVLVSGPEALAGAGAEVSAWSPWPEVRDWAVHPECACHLAPDAGVPTALSPAATPARP